jgi:hypothetical protein
VKQPGFEYFLPFPSFSGTALAVSSLVGICAWWLCFGGEALPSWSVDRFGDSVNMTSPWSSEAEAMRPPPDIVDCGALSLQSVHNWSELVKLACLSWLPSVSGLVLLSVGVSPRVEGTKNNPELGG